MEKLSDKELYTIKLLSQLLFGLLEVISDGKVISFDGKINNAYLELSEALEELTKGDFVRPFDSLFLIGEDVESKWKEGFRNKLLHFVGITDHWFIKNGEKRFKFKELDKKYYDLILKNYSLIRGYEKYKKGIERQFDEEIEMMEKEAEGLAEFNAKRRCKFENNAFYFYLADGSEKNLSFDSKKNNNLLLKTFEYFYKTWQQCSRNGSVIIKREGIIDYLDKEGIKNKNANDIRNITSSLRTKIGTCGLEKTIILGYFSIKDEGYPFQINLPL